MPLLPWLLRWLQLIHREQRDRLTVLFNSFACAVEAVGGRIRTVQILDKVMVGGLEGWRLSNPPQRASHPPSTARICPWT